MTLFDLLKLALATWYLSFVVTSTTGPGGIFSWIRDHVPHGRRSYFVFSKTEAPNIKTGEEIKIHGLLDCIVCTAVWIALVLRIVEPGIVIDALAVAGAAMILHGYSGWRFGG